MITGIVVALPEEFRTLTSGKVEKGNYCKLTDNILLAYAGTGSENAQKASELLTTKGVGQLISWGCAAALAPELKPGDLVLPRCLLTEDNQELNCDQNWIDQVCQILPSDISINLGQLTESRTIVAETKDKQLIHSQTGAVALDMESCAIAKAAIQAQIPCLVVRVIADPVSMNLPTAVSHALNSEGEIKIGKLLIYLLSQPMEIPALIKLGLHFNGAKKTLKSIAKYLDKITER